jgi:hypothetical protein
MQKEVFSEIIEMSIQAISYSMRDKHKKNNLDYSIQDINWVE